MKTSNYFSRASVTYIILIVILIFSLPSCSQNGEKDENTFVIACNLPLSGDLATYGVSIRDGVNFGLSHLKNDSINLIFDWQDNASIPRNAVNIFQRHRNQGFDVYTSGVKPQTMAIIDNVAATGKPHFVWVFDAFICQQYDNTYRTWVNYKIEPDFYMQYIQHKKPERIAILYANLPHTIEEFNDILIPRLTEEMGFDASQDILAIPYDWQKLSFRDVVTQVSAYKPDLIILNGFKGTIMSILRSLREFNLVTDGNTIVTYDMLDAAEDLRSEITEGVRVIAPRFSFEDDNLLWREEFAAKFGRQPKYTDAYAYDLVTILYHAFVKSTKIDNQMSFEDAILNMNVDGITGLLQFDEDGDLIIDLQIGVYRDGVLLPDSVFYSNTAR